jgi:nickel-dependent lactate racemase
MAKINMPYGNDVIELDVPAGHKLILPPKSVPLADTEEVFRQAFVPLTALAAHCHNIVIVVSDGTRSTGSHLWLPHLNGTLHAAGAREDEITFLVACGSHRPTTDAEKQTILGDELYGRYRIIDHDATDENVLVYVGTTASGTPVWINKLAQQADLLVVTGTSGLHYFAGYGGGAKSILPGISGWETIKTNHFRNFLGSRRNPLCRPANDLDNPLFRDMQEAARLVNIGFMVTTVLDSEENITGFFAGADWEEVARLGRRAVDAQFIAEDVCEPADLVIVSAGGEPFDKNIIQAHKALEFASFCLKPGGTMLGVVRCREGVGSPPILKYLPAKNLDEFYELMRADYHPHGQCAFAMREKCERFRMLLYTELEDDIVRAFGATKFTDPGLALKEACRVLKPGAQRLLVPHGHHVLPRNG